MATTNYILTSNGNFISEDELYHWGIKGMKWGVRRYQNPDGTLTSAGRKRLHRNSTKGMGDEDYDYAKRYRRREALSSEETINELKQFAKTASDPDFDGNSESGKKWIDMDKEIRDHSGSFYNGKGVSKGFKDAVDRHESMSKEIDAKYGDNVHSLFRKRDELIKSVSMEHMSPANKASIKLYDRVLDMKDFERAYEKASNDDRVKNADVEYRKASNEYSRVEASERHRYLDELSGVILKDLGYKDSSEARKLIQQAFLYD